jgi:hypothetical protein
MHLTAPSDWPRSIGTGGRDPSERVVTIAGMRNQAPRALVGCVHLTKITDLATTLAISNCERVVVLATSIPMKNSVE